MIKIKDQYTMFQRKIQNFTASFLSSTISKQLNITHFFLIATLANDLPTIYQHYKGILRKETQKFFRFISFRIYYLLMY